MKLHPIALLICSTLLLSACQGDATKQPIEKDTLAVDVVKETMPIEKVKEDALYSWEVQDGEHTAELYLLADDGTKEKGDEPYNGDLAFYLVDGADGVLQEHLASDLKGASIQLDESPFQINTFNEKTMLTWIAPEGEKNGTLTMWGYLDGEMKQVSFDDEKQLVITGNQVKFIKEQYLQTYTYNDGTDESKGVGWYYTTWQWDATAYAFSTFDTTQYIKDDANGWESGEFLSKLWHEHESEFISFPHITLTSEFAGLVEKGMLFDNSFQLGDSIDSVLEKFPDFLNHDYYEGGTYYSYPDGSYFYDESTREITFITLNGGLLTNDLSSIISILGEPDESGFNEMEQANYVLFYSGANQLTVYSDESGKLSGFWLTAK